ncbi:MAG TPA: hypothetical protein DEG17_07990 [Cyanobacteria bacterium UBA11149]|nr:hypothetical protein [Cyanobacteria bacterium UBA11367]HBE56737.1 hypothetical protein [Cyanobacteria bacterium UBA11366]HBK64760.1 hypothetical protein [Cyanobacteria bacterium UBA11166]HBR76228.1 hypothetical protein [Cyanobacteria bacterium UBA11159]HBS71300.1 hypothetical protein [Cyanobacteria bacterium UBA11153]HBW88802.1 hypothetical protein [Cyanobacteria bacterium UBA11149]HCA96941.1 hypothetical protein [Cyanobacteria bacterium UBA9226]
METFILWSPSFDERVRELSFFATEVQIQRINQGTQEMLQEMLHDIGISGVDVENWTINPFLTNYLMDEPPSSNWKDIWADTWEIKLKLTESIKLEVEYTDLIRTWASDTTWKGEPLYLPSKCVVVADFYNSETLEKAKKILDRVGDLRNNASLIDDLHAQVPYLPKDLFINIRSAYLEMETNQGNDINNLEARQRAGLLKQLILSLGIFDDKFFINGAKLAKTVSDLVYELDGTTTWNETTDPYQYS